VLGPHRLTDGPLVPWPAEPRRKELRRLGLGLILLGVCSAFAVRFHRPLLEGYARLFRVDDPAPSDAIVMLLGGLEARPRKPASLFREGPAPRVLLCTGPPAPPGQLSEALYSARTLVNLGVTPQAITPVQSPVTSTKEEAEAILAIARKDGMNRITVVTTSFHTVRAAWIFRKVFHGSGIETRIAAATDPLFDETNWHLRDESLIVYFIEMVKTLFYRFRY
jgi:uncharacterized SAM-binding protein YcdF (DUF218 family)